MVQPPPAPAEEDLPPLPAQEQLPLPTQEQLHDALEEINSCPNFELRFRLHAAGAPAKFAQHRDALRSMIDRVQATADPVAKNAIGEQHGLSLGFFAPKPHTTIIFQVTVLLKDGLPRHDMPIETGKARAHTVLGEQLLRVRVEPAQRHNVQEKERRAQLLENVVREGLTNIAGNCCFSHFCHKDADKGIESEQLWFVKIHSYYISKRRPETCVHNLRNLLLDTTAFADGRPTKPDGSPNKHLTVSKINARLCLAFSSAVAVDACAPTDHNVLDLRGTSQGSWQELWELPPKAPGHVQMVIVDDVHGQRDGEATEHLMTDGAGTISANIARCIPRCTSGRVVDQGVGNAPLLCQVRVWHRGYVAKGVLMSDSSLPDGYIVLRDSMVKVHARDDCDLSAETKLTYGLLSDRRSRSAFEVLRTSNSAPSGKMNPMLVPLLEHAGGKEKTGNKDTDERKHMRRLLVNLCDQHIQRIIQLQSDELSGPQLRNLLQELGLSQTCAEGATAAEMLLAGFHPSTEPYLKQKVAAVVKSQLDRVASGRFNLPGSLYLTGVPDPTGTIETGDVVILEAGKHVVEDKILIYRSPGTAAGDLRLSRSVVPSPELLLCLQDVAMELQNAIIFSTRGERALADMMAGGDYDGDEFLIMRGSVCVETTDGRSDNTSLPEAVSHQPDPWDPNDIVARIEFATDAPAAPPPLMPANLSYKDQVDAVRLLQDHYLMLSQCAGNIGKCANLIQAAQELFGVEHWKTRQAVAHYYAALDAAKNGHRLTYPQELEREIDQIGWPCFMTAKAQGYCNIKPEGSSNSAQGQMWGRRPDAAGSEDLIVEPDPDCDFKLRRCPNCGVECGADSLREHKRMCQQVRSLQQQLGLPMPAPMCPVVEGFYGSTREGFFTKWTALVQQAKCELRELYAKHLGGITKSKRSNVALQQEKRALIARYRQRLLEDYEPDERERPAHMLLCEASHVYLAVYASAQNSRGAPMLELAWQIAGEWLCIVKWMSTATRHTETMRPGAPPRGLVAPDVLPKLLARRGQASAATEARGAEVEVAAIEEIEGGPPLDADGCEVDACMFASQVLESSRCDV